MPSILSIIYITAFNNVPPTPYTVSICHLPNRSIVSYMLFKIHKRPKYIFQIRLHSFTLLPYSQHLVHAPTTLVYPAPMFTQMPLSGYINRHFTLARNNLLVTFNFFQFTLSFRKSSGITQRQWPDIPKVAFSCLTGCSKSCDLLPAFAPCKYQ